MLHLILSLVTGLFVGGGVMWFALAWRRSYERRWAEEEASQLIDGAKKDAQAQSEEQQMAFEEMKDEAWEKFERETRRLVQRNEENGELLVERETTLNDTFNQRHAEIQRRNAANQSKQSKQTRLDERVASLRARMKSLSEQILGEAKKRASVSEDDLKEQIRTRLEQQVRTTATRRAQEFEQDAHANVERDAKRMINLALNRFARPYCAERGIGNISFENPEHKLRVFGQDGQWIKRIEQLCGVDIVYNETYMSATIMGFDPVRRELGRLVTDAASRERQPLSDVVIERIHDRCKKELFKKILTDGNRVANELRIPNLHENVRSMLGSLRYRYSFAQNQHFHVAEVGWLCGLLSAELGLNVNHGRRSGLLHDIGKAMDHSKEGGHAVIGAEFIESHGEVPEVVHAVRAHHYDETPSTDLAFLTIAADAMSGARPGARRSTMDSYTQKMADLEKIATGFDGVNATYILSAGREVRVMVDGHKVDDQKSLVLSKEIAKKIEDELSYPGLIKVTVVRETQAVDFAR